ncbi:hypothetical protein [Arenibaculum pallidiluteum]|uniref:hypothetical protein n=1 Tax=Arenibaculum pallidiluteum TaxID=2812559 RepID=UPI001A962880|nr:hypothetical protein [Arenibaculum pallidiluteum]
MTVDITPEVPLPLAGYAGRGQEFTRVDAPLEANLAAFEGQDGAAVVLASVDTLFLDDRLADMIARASGVPRRNLLLVASHTHNAPSLAPSVPRLGRFDDSYGAAVAGRIAGAIRRLTDGPGVPVSARFGKRQIPINVNRRRPAWTVDYGAVLRGRRPRCGRTVAMASWRRGIVDPDLRCIVFASGAGQVMAVLWSYCCHPAFYPSGLHVSPDFPGAVREALRDAFGRSCAVLYFPGFAGSAIPDIPFHMPRSARELLSRALPFNPGLRSFTPAAYAAWTRELVRAAVACAEEAGERALASGVVRRSAASAEVFLPKAPAAGPGIRLEAARIDFGDGLAVVAVNGEMIGEWAPLLGRLLPDTGLATGYLAGPCLYVPTDDAVAAGGYEADRFRGAFGLEGEFAGGLDDIVRRTFSELDGRAGRERRPAQEADRSREVDSHDHQQRHRA